MSDTPNTPAPLNPIRSIREDVKKGISDNNKQVRERIVATLVETQIVSRTELVTKAISAYDSISNDFNKARPDNKTYNPDGTVASETYTQAQAQKRVKAQGDLTKITEALSAAIDDGDYTKLTDFMSKWKPSSEKNSDKSESSGLS